jgi:hypothetical protein
MEVKEIVSSNLFNQNNHYFSVMLQIHWMKIDIFLSYHLLIRDLVEWPFQLQDNIK